MIEVGVLVAMMVMRWAWGYKNGLHWWSRPRRKSGARYHAVDAVQTWSFRVAAGLLLMGVLGVSGSSGMMMVGILWIDHQGWQLLLNVGSGNGLLSGEQRTVVYDWVVTEVEMVKRFRNERRVVGIALGWAVVIIGWIWRGLV